MGNVHVLGAGISNIRHQNLIRPAYADQSYRNYSTGEWQESSWFGTSDYVEIPNGIKYVTIQEWGEPITYYSSSIGLDVRIAFYDAGKTFIPSIKEKGTTVINEYSYISLTAEIPENAKYVVFTWRSNDFRDAAYKVKAEFSQYGTEWTPAPEDVIYAGAVVGGRNLLKGSDKMIETAEYGVASYHFGNEIPIEGEVYTIQIKGKLGDDRSAFVVFNTGSNINLGEIRQPNTRGIYELSFVWKNATHSGSTTVVPSFVRIYQREGAGTSASKIEWVKLERGMIATAWTPAPEDIESRLAAIEAKLGITADPPMVDGPEMEEDMDMDDMAHAGGVISLSGYTSERRWAA